MIKDAPTPEAQAFAQRQKTIRRRESLIEGTDHVFTTLFGSDFSGPGVRNEMRFVHSHLKIVCYEPNNSLFGCDM
jgi:hypothetical protein